MTENPQQSPGLEKSEPNLNEYETGNFDSEIDEYNFSEGKSILMPMHLSFKGDSSQNELNSSGMIQNVDHDEE